MTLAELKDALQEFFGDTSRSQHETREGLLDIAADATLLAEGLEADDDEDYPDGDPNQ